MCMFFDTKDIMSYNFDELQDIIVGFGEKAFRTKQIYGWFHQKLVSDFDEMNNISNSLRDRLRENYDIYMPNIVEVYKSKIDGTSKYLFKMHDGSIIESVLMKYKHGNSVCISSQVGCRMGCKFCASTLDGLERNLSASEMLGQIYMIQKDTGERVSNVVIMGSGEPFDNYDNVIRFLELVSDEKGLNISSRNITLSTCGIVEKIKKLADMKLQITLAVSIHSPNDTLRKQIMPIANKYGVNEIVEACRYYFDKTGRRITFEYSLMKGVNDSSECADELAHLIKGLNCPSQLTIMAVKP